MENKKKQLIIVCPEPYYGKGGISTAVGGLIDGFNELGVEVITVESHSSHESKWQVWLKAAIQVRLLSKKYGDNAVFVFHCGAWFSMFRKWTLALIANFYRSTTVVHLHSIVVENYIAKRFSKLLFKLFLSTFDRVFTVSPWWTSLLEKKLTLNNVSNLFNSVTYSAMEIAFKQCKKQIPTFDAIADIKLVSMSRLVEGKGFEALIESLTLLPERYKLTIAGEGNLRPKLVNLVNKLSLEERVQFVGWVESDEKYNLMLDSHVFVLAAKAESFGMGLIEAMACGLPVIALDRGPIRDVVTSDTGLLVNEDTPQCLAEAIIHLTGNMSTYNGGPLRVVTVFNPQLIADKAYSVLFQDNRRVS